MREPGLWMVTAGAALVAFYVGGSIEQNAIAWRDNFGGPAPVIAHGVAVLLAGVATYQWCRQPRRRPDAGAGPGLPRWQGYGIALLGVAWLALAAVTWFLTELKSPTLMLAMLLTAAAHLLAGVTVVRRSPPLILSPTR